MNMAHPDIDTEELRQRILDAAQNRFLTYGYSKTTMAEIAHDASMSAANLYRYFENKQEIGAECAERCMSGRIQHIRQAIRNPKLSAAQQLHTFVLESYNYNLEQNKNQPKVNELVEYVCQERKTMVYEKIEAQVSLLAEILAHGNQTGEFNVADVISQARYVYASMILFDVPVFIHLFNREEFENLINGVVELLLAGLRSR